VAEFAVAEACFRLSTPGTISVDAGANVGQMTSALAYALGSAGSVYAFEPHPIVFGYLQQNVTRLRSEVPEVTCQVFNEALGQKTGEATLYVPERWSENTGVASLRQESNAEEIQVPVQRLDDRVPEPIQVLKLDVQGLETEVLRGAERHLEEETIRHVLFEAHDIQESAAADLLRSYGYTIFAIEKTVMGPRLHRTLPDNEHNFIASLDAAECRARFSSSGWRCLHTA
jgi:FkbM family methyltransferase